MGLVMFGGMGSLFYTQMAGIISVSQTFLFIMPFDSDFCYTNVL